MSAAPDNERRFRLTDNELARAQYRALLGPLDPAQRYTINEACAYLRLGRNSVYNLIAAGELPVIKDNKRTYIPGSAIAARSRLPEAASA